MKVGTIAQSDGVVKALLIVAAEDSLQVTATMDPDGQQVMPNDWYPYSTGKAAILFAPTVAQAKIGQYVVTLADGAATTLSAELLPFSALEVPSLTRFELLTDGAHLVWQPVVGAVEYSVVIIDHDNREVTQSVFVTEPEAILPAIDATNYSVVVRAYNFHYSADSINGWPVNPQVSELQFQGPLIPPR